MEENKVFNEYLYTVLPDSTDTKYSPGDKIKVKSNDRFKYYIMDTSREWIFDQGITDAEQSRINKLNDVQVTKLEGLNTQAEITQEINTAVIQANGTPIPITSNVLPQGGSVPAVITVIGSAQLIGGVGGTTYTQTGGSSIVVAEGKIKFAYYTRSTNLWTEGVELPLIIPSASVEVKPTNPNSTSSLAVYNYINGNPIVLGTEKVLSTYTTNPTPSATLVVQILSRVFEDETGISSIEYNGVVAGKIAFCVFSRNVNTLTRVSAVDIDISLGINTLDLSVYNLHVPKGGMVGYVTGSGYIARIGLNATAPEADYHTFVGTTIPPFTLPAKATIGGLGIKLTYIYPYNSVQKQLNNLNNNIDLGKLYDIGWVPELGAISPNYTLNSGYITLSFTAGNQSINMPNSLTNGVKTYIQFKAKVTLGTSANLLVGYFVTNNQPPKTYKVPIIEVEQTFIYELEGNVTNSISIGLLTADNFGQVVIFKEFKVFSKNSIPGIQKQLADLEDGVSTIVPKFSFNIDSPFNSLSKYDKRLNVLLILGDSLMANATGGAIPIGNLEPSVSRRPLRLGESNNIARRTYDYLSWNKPQFRRLDDADWFREGTWTTINTTALFEPTYTNEKYHITSTNGSKATIVVPQGNDNFALFYRIGTTSGTMSVYLNNVLYQTINTNKTTAGHTGNPYKILAIELNINQANTIRIEYSNVSANPIYVWGGFYWAGKTIIVINAGHGGHTLQNLIDNHIDDEVVDNTPDVILFELTLMNDAGRMTDAGNTIQNSVNALKTILYNKINGKDVIVMSCQPYGTDPVDGTPNYYINYPGMEEMKDALKNVVHEAGLPYIGVFEFFKTKIINNKGTLAGGQGGILYTTDGQHQNELGSTEYWNMIKPLLSLTPIKID